MEQYSIKISNTAEFLALSEELNASEKSYVFRGLSSGEHALNSSIERDIPEPDIKKLGYGYYEAAILKKFFQYEPLPQPLSPYDNTDLIEIWSMIQHYGGRTRLIDFTKSIAVALYFAINNHREVANPLIWCIPEGPLESAIVSLFANRTDDDDLKKKGFSKIPSIPDGWKIISLYPKHPKVNTIINHLLRISLNGFGHENSLVNCVIPIYPNRSNHRIAAQSGLFLMPLNNMNTFIGNLLNMFPGKQIRSTVSPDALIPFERSMIRTSIKNNEIFTFQFKDFDYREFRNLMNLLNANTQSLFPDFPGLIKNLSEIGPLKAELR